MKWLTQALIISGALNIGLALALFLVVVQDSSLATEHKPAKEEKVAEDRGHAAVLSALSLLSFTQLIDKLNSKELVEDGFYERDLALGVLVSQHHFDIIRALPSASLHPRVFALMDAQGKVGMRVKVFGGLSEAEFRLARQFALVETWPLTAEGLFWQLKQVEKDAPSSLIDAFCLTEEFALVETLFERVGCPKTRGELLEIILKGDWPLLHRFGAAQKNATDLSPACHQRFLLDYVARGSPPAAMVFLQKYGALAIKKLDDAHVIALLELLDEKNVYSEAFAKAMLISPRSDAVWQLAALRLYQFAKEEMPKPYDHLTSLKRFVSHDVIVHKIAAAKAGIDKALPKEMNRSSYTVVEGDSLWNIAKKNRVSIEALKKANNLSSDSIHPGRVLQIPVI